jgi:AcrR family transcriptional regulator
VDDDTAQAKLLDAADRLFYAHGIRSVGMDQIRDASGVSLKRLYRIFPAKDQLAETVLRRRDLAFRQSLAEYVAVLASPRDKILGIFDFLYAWFSEPDYRGCPFINAFGEMNANSTNVTASVEEQKQAFSAFLADLVAAADGTPAVAEQLFILANGAMVAAAVLHSPEPARQAQRAAALLLTASP